MIGFEQGRLNQQRIQDLRREAAGIVAARHAGAPTSAKRVAGMLRGIAARIDGQTTATTTTNSPLHLSQARGFAR